MTPARTALLRRDREDDHGTIGVLSAPGLGPLQIMEPPWRDNRRNRSCIPPGSYVVLPHLSPRFGRCLLVAGVGSAAISCFMPAISAATWSRAIEPTRMAACFRASGAAGSGPANADRPPS